MAQAIQYREILNVYDSYKVHSHKRLDSNQYDNLIKFTQTGVGSYKTFKLFSKMMGSLAEIFKRLNFSSEFIDKLQGASKKFNFASKAMIVTKIPSSLKDFKLNIEKVKSEDFSHKKLEKTKTFRKIFESISDAAILIQFGEVLQLYTLGGVISPVIKLSSNIFLTGFYLLSSKLEITNYIKEKKFEDITKKHGSERLQTIATERKRLAMLNLASTAVAIFMLIEIIFKFSIISEIALLAVSTITIILSVWSFFYKESMTYPIEK